MVSMITQGRSGRGAKFLSLFLAGVGGGGGGALEESGIPVTSTPINGLKTKHAIPPLGRKMAR